MNKGNNNVSESTINRLPRYRRYLKELEQQGITKVSSNELGEQLGYTPSQVRQDLNRFGAFGRQGYGYSIKTLHENIDEILGLNQKYKMIVVGAGNLGQAISRYAYYQDKSFEVSALFDTNTALVGTEAGTLPIYALDDVSDYIRENNIDIGIICIPKEPAQAVADIIIDAGIKAIWNFAPTDLNVPENFPIKNVHLSDSLQTLTYQMKI